MDTLVIIFGLFVFYLIGTTNTENVNTMNFDCSRCKAQGDKTYERRKRKFFW